MNNVDIVNEILEVKNNIVFFGGAGVSCESGIPDFRSSAGLYNMDYAVSPEEILSHHFFVTHTDVFYKFYKKNLVYLNAKPNYAHIKLSLLEKNKNITIITQNIDGLHQKAGSTRVLELHGSIYKNYCTKCNKQFDIHYIMKNNDIPYCDLCGGIIRPDVVLYEESLDENIVNQAVKSISKAELLIIGGTSLSVYPAAGLIDYYTGKDLILINKNNVPYPIQNKRIVYVTEPIAEFFKKIK